MAERQLKNKPLIEAIVELRWQLEDRGLGQEHDPHYKLLLGRLFDRLQPEYPEHEELPTASIPDELVGHIVQHRFRTAANAWPLVQLGPGIITLNSTSDYAWSEFRRRAIVVVQQLYGAHPKSAGLRVGNLVLRYVNAVNFDVAEANAFEFLRDKLKIGIDLPKTLFNATQVTSNPKLFMWQSAFQCTQPSATVTLKFASGQREGEPAIIWETTVQASSEDVPSLPGQFENWIDAAHKLADDWFFKLIEGELERRFS